MPVFEKRSPMPVDADTLFAWHARLAAFDRLNPPFERVEVEERSGGVEVGARHVIRMRVGPIEQRWVLEHTALEPGRMFRDEQRQGPLRRWVHTHRFVPQGDTSALEDHVEYELPPGVPAAWVRRRMERLFAYRHALTRMDLERHARFKGRRRATIAITGASGLIGMALQSYPAAAGHTVRVVRRGANGNPDPDALEGSDAVVHLAGANIVKRWSRAYREEVVASRVAYTRALVAALKRCEQRPRVLVSGSAVGVYGDRGEEVLDERSPLPVRGAKGAAFLAALCADWEDAGHQATDLGMRVVLLRTGVVLTAHGGALAALLPAFRAGLGGPQGSGRQYVSWVSLEDELGAIEHALFDEGVVGPLNGVGPAPVTNEELAQTLGRVLKRPARTRVPEAALKLLFGETADAALLASQRALPGALLATGFSFQHAELEAALRFTLGR
jgi:uncharacterized protein (TIGR01777 family)